jgi:5-methylthioadenosine/S-adenosylhomocysteine deaminase
MKTLIEGTIIPLTEERDEFDGFVAIEGNRITSVSEEKPEGYFDKSIDASGMVIMPGLVNTHTHASMTLLRGVADDLPLMDWLNKEIFPRENKLTSDMVFWGAKLAIAEMLLGGVTTFNDMYFKMDSVAKAVSQTGIRASLSSGIMAVGGQEAIDRAVDFANQWNNKADGRIKTMLGPHAIYTCPPYFMELLVKASNDNKIPIHIHISETEKEVNDCISEYNETPPKILNRIGVFDSHVVGAHCVQLTDSDMDILKTKDVYLSLNTSSNFKLASGRARIATMEEKGLNLSIGTDGTASNNDLDMWEELRWTSFVAKSFGDSTVLPAKRTLQIATVDGAQALGFSDMGTLEKGAIADLIIVDMSTVHLNPRYSSVSHLVNCVHPSDVRHVIVDGKIVVWERKIQRFDADETLAKVKEFAKILA